MGDLTDQLRSARLRDLCAAVAGDEVSRPQLVASAAIFRAHRIISTQIEAALVPLGLTPARFETLALVATAEGGRMTFMDLKRSLLQHPATLTYTIDALEKAGLMRRERSPEDRRVVIAEITPRGRELAELATTTLDGVRFGLGGITEQEAERMAILLSALDEDSDEALAGAREDQNGSRR